MSIFAIPIATNFVVGTHLSSMISETNNKHKTLALRFQQIQNHFQSTNQLPSCDKWNMSSIATITAIALGINNPPEKEKPQTLSDWNSNVQRAQAHFNVKFGSASIPQCPIWLKATYIIAVIAQSVICYKTPLSPLLRLLSLTTTIVLPLIAFFKHQKTLSSYQNMLNQMYRFTNSYPELFSGTFERFIFRGQMYMSRSENKEFNPIEIREIALCLSLDTSPLSLGFAEESHVPIPMLQKT